MGLKSTRIILSILLAIVIAVSTAVGALIAVSQLTVGNKDFYIENIVSNQLVDECNQQLSKKYTALAEKSNIPLDIFESVKMQYSTKASLSQAMSYVFDENDSTLNTEVRTAYFEDIINQYLEANKISLKDSSVKAVAEEATKIYSDVVGIHNMDYLQNQVKIYQNENTKLLSLFVLLTAISVFALFMLYKKREKALAYVADGVLAGGLAVILSSILRLAIGVGTRFSVLPYFYDGVFAGLAKKVLAFSLLGGVILLIIGAVLFGLHIYYARRRKNREDTRFAKVITKL